MFDDFDMTAQCEEFNWIFYALCFDEMVGEFLGAQEDEEVEEILDELFYL